MYNVLQLRKTNRIIMIAGTNRFHVNTIRNMNYCSRNLLVK